MKYDYLIVGSGLFGATFSQLASLDNKKCLIVDKRNHIGGNCFTEKNGEIDIHKYGPHIFHTNDITIWNYVNQFTSFNNYINRPKVSYNDNIYSFPINLMTLYQVFGVKNPIEAKETLDSVKIKIENPQNLEEWSLSQIGEELYKIFIYGYTKKQWGTDPKNLPSFIIKRLPIRLNFDDNYFFDKYQGIPINGYTEMISNMIGNTEVILEYDYFNKKSYYDSLAKRIVYTGPIDKFFDYEHGSLSYRSLRFDVETKNISDYQGNAIVNYTSESIPYTRIIEHKHFNNAKSEYTIISKEYPERWSIGSEEYYPINDENNTYIYNKYKKLSLLNNKYIFGGRLAEYRYYDMHQVIGSAMNNYSKVSKN
jgi:UDP-galactopyranose mutase